VSTLHNGVDTDFFQPLGLQRDAKTIVFEGKVGFRPNADGIRFFVSEIFPEILEADPEVRLMIVGKDPPKDIVALSSPAIEVTGFVDDVRPFVDRAQVFVCPLRTGAGIKNKVLQAWAMGKAVVATSASVGGLHVEEGINIFVRDTPHEFAQAVLNLLRDPLLAARVGARARETALSHYTWDAKAEELDKLMRVLTPA
jgi:glycosyltransferase involved in cell wall biosynthesis